MFWAPQLCLPDSLGETKRTEFTNICERNKRDRDLLLINLMLTMIDDEQYTRITKCYGNVSERHILSRSVVVVYIRTFKRNGIYLSFVR